MGLLYNLYRELPLLVPYRAAAGCRPSLGLEKVRPILVYIFVCEMCAGPKEVALSSSQVSGKFYVSITTDLACTEIT